MIARLLVVVVLCAASASSWAIGWVAPGSGMTWSRSGVTGSSCESVCQQLHGGCVPWNGTGTSCADSFACTYPSPSVGACTYHWENRTQYGNVSNSGTGSDTIQGTPSTTCPSGSSPDTGGTCKCNPGLRPGAGNTCVPYDCPRGGLTFANDGYGPLSQTDVMKSRLTCVGSGSPYYGCTLEFTAASAKCADATHCWSTGSSQTNGEYCDGTPTQPKTPPPDEPTLPPPSPPCADQPGTCPGSINGQSACLACSWTEDKPKTTTGDDGNGNTTGTETKTECNGTTCTTTTTTTTSGPGGTGTTVSVDVEPQPGFCEQNPTFSACKDGRWGGSCLGGFSCDGDAIQCAVAREQHVRNCQLYETHSAYSQAGAALSDDNPHPTGHPYNDAETKTVDFAQQIDQSDALGGGSCPGDRTIAIHGGSFVIPFSSLCGPLAFFGQVAVAFCLLAAAFIAFKQ